jgi:two-component system phosphate regulon sensor histidine kinase PhoR
MAHLAEKMNDMAALLDERIHTITEQRNEIEAVLSGMVEGVIALDSQENVIKCNEAAEELFNIDRKTIRGKSIHEAIRNIRMQKIVNTIRAGNDPVEDEIVLHGETERILQVHGSRFPAAGGKEPGMVLVFNDITRLKRLETVRRDFVSNVSHELKTPITSIIGFVETLKTGGSGKEGDHERFMDIILKNSRRLNSIVEDLLSLSRIEQETERGTVALERNDICSILSSAVAQYETPARKKNITIDLNCDTAITIRGNASLLVQAVGNLIDNAIKYSARDTDIRVSARREESSVIVEVQDNGNGIPREHLPRIFERFYRVDKGRSRDLGGTGLGLAIVKHIVLAHGGHISVDSMLGKGSTFTITFPAT